MRKLILLSLISATLTSLLYSCKNDDELALGRYYANGKILYQYHCENCHSKDGKGLGLLIPPLTDTLFLKQNKKLLGCFIRHGLAKKITVNDAIYNENMPADDHLSDMEIAQIIVYVTNSFGNNQGNYNVTEANADLKNCK